MGVGGFILGSVAGQLLGAWTYWRIRGKGPETAIREVRAAAAAGFVTTVTASAIYILLGVHTWLGGDGMPWGMSIFMGLCMGVCQGVLFRGRPLRPPPR